MRCRSGGRRSSIARPGAYAASSGRPSELRRISKSLPSERGGRGLRPPFPALVERLGPGDVAEHETEATPWLCATGWPVRRARPPSRRPAHRAGRTPLSDEAAPASPSREAGSWCARISAGGTAAGYSGPPARTPRRDPGCAGARDAPRPRITHSNHKCTSTSAASDPRLIRPRRDDADARHPPKGRSAQRRDAPRSGSNPAADGGTELSYAYAVQVTGKIAAVGGRMLDAAARALIDQAFARIAGGRGKRPDGLVGMDSRPRRPNVRANAVKPAPFAYARPEDGGGGAGAAG